MEDLFIRPAASYKRQIDLKKNYIQDTARYLQLQTGRSIEECRAFVQTQIAPNGPTPWRDPEVMFLERNKVGDRQIERTTFQGYLDAVRDNNEILAPTMTGYIPADQKSSLLSGYITDNLGKRKAAKAEKFDAEMAGNMVLAGIKEGQQSSQKIKNNSLSGAFCSPYTILYNKTAHSTLTSVCRCATSYGNANNERFLYGNRHYWAPDVVKANVVSILNNTNLEKFEQLMRSYRLRAPTVEETIALIYRSTSPYWRISDQNEIIASMVRSMKAVERAAYAYTGDFYHLAQFNPEFCRRFIQGLIQRADQSLSVDEADKVLKAVHGSLKEHVSMVCADLLAGETMSDTKKNRPEDYGRIAATTLLIQRHIEEHAEFIKTFWVSDNLPSSIFMLPSIIRRGVITSDTDSTIFTVAYWTKWYRGQLDYTAESVAVSSAMVYLSSNLIRHILARISGNMGVAKQDVMRLNMKNEYYFPTFVLTSRAKHYFAYIGAQEGNVFKNKKMEIKGVALRNSNIPPEITKTAKKLMENIMDSIMQGQQLSMDQVFQLVAKKEREILDDVEAGGYSNMSRMQIKSPDSYKNPERSNYIHYGLWEEVFAPKYGYVAAPPYRAIKVSVDIDTPSKFKEWLASLEDRALAQRMEDWAARQGRKDLTAFLLPEPILQMRGVPKEIVQAINKRKLIAQIMEAFYLILESLGIFMKNDNNTRLVSDTDWLLK